MAERKGCIYVVTHEPTGKMYVGQTTRKPSVRWNEHRKGARFLSEDIQHLGPESFHMAVLEEGVLAGDLDAHERGWISLLGTVCPNGFNRTTGGSGFAEHSAETKAKMSATRKGRPHTTEWSAKIAASNRGKRSPRKGVRLSDETRARMSAAQALRRANNLMSDVTRAKIAAANRRRGPASEETKAKMAASQTGRKLSLEARAKIWATRRANEQERASAH